MIGTHFQKRHVWNAKPTAIVYSAVYCNHMSLLKKHDSSTFSRLETDFPLYNTFFLGIIKYI